MTRSIGKSNRSTKTPATQEKIRNIGPKSAAWLKQVGIKSTADIAGIGAFNAFLKVRRAGFKASLSLIYALAGAEDDCDWRELNPDRKQTLLAQYESFEAEQKAARKIFTPRSGTVGSILEQALGKSDGDAEN